MHHAEQKGRAERRLCFRFLYGAMASLIADADYGTSGGCHFRLRHHDIRFQPLSYGMFMLSLRINRSLIAGDFDADRY